jgi:hypothetical protein
VENIVNNASLNADVTEYCKILFEIIAMINAIDQQTSIEFKKLLEKRKKHINLNNQYN